MGGLQAFDRYIGIDYSGAETPKSSRKGLRVYMADRSGVPTEVSPPPSPRRYWTRRGIAEWPVDRLSEAPRTLVGIDHGFSFPLKYFDKYHLPYDWPAFLDDFQRHWPTDDPHMYVDFIRYGHDGTGNARSGNPRWRRATEVRAGAKSVFHFDVPGSVASPPMPGYPGCAMSDHMHPTSISGPSTDGISPRDDQLWQKSIPLFGAGASRGTIGTTISMTHFQLRNGCAVPTVTGRLQDSSLPHSRLPRRKQRISRAGYWELSELWLRSDASALFGRVPDGAEDPLLQDAMRRLPEQPAR